KDVKYLIINEKSIVSLIGLAYVNKRLRKAIPNIANEWFGRLSVLLCGDFF
ncbi:hypothetical protein M438DRAFT_274033, partial [Aureobasidium pullulans EXF-150]